MNYFFTCLLFFSFFLLPKSIFAAPPEYISSFHSDIVINQDTSLSILEEIVYTTTFPKHGMYRSIPLYYNQGGHQEMFPINNFVVTDETERPIAFERSFDNPFLKYKIGDPDSTFTGTKTYRISYTVERALRQFDDHAELYWDITGEGWHIPILQSAATIHSEFAPIERLDCFSGEVGSNDQQCQASMSQDSATFMYNSVIDYGKNMTVAVWLPKENNFIFPTKSELFMLWLRLNWALLIMPLPLVLMIAWWFRSGRDKQYISSNVFLMDPNQPFHFRPWWQRGREPFVYEPLADLSPGEAGALLDEKADMQDVLAELLELARKKYIEITATTKQKLLSKKTEYVFKKLKPADDGISPAQLLLYTRLFKSGDETTTTALKGHFYSTISKVQEELTASLTEKKLYTKNPMATRAMGMGVFVVSVFTTGFLIMISLGSLGIVWPLYVVGLQVPFGLLLAYNLPQKTAVGTNLWLQARGLRKKIERGKWREVVKEKNLFIEEVLPFAVALGVVSKLTKDMQELGLESPKYLQGNQLLNASAADWVSDFSTEAQSSLEYNPSSSSSSGGSGFSGGGSSGGGGGGGGGGSW